jgi:uncharacterized protein YkwD
MRTPGLLVVAATGLVLTAGLVAATTAGAQTSPDATPDTAAPAQDWPTDPWTGGDFSGDAWPWVTESPDPQPEPEPTVTVTPSDRPTVKPDPKPDPKPAARPAAKPAAKPAAEPAVPDRAPGEDGGMQQDALRLTNDARRRHGCPALTVDARLVQAARRHAADMASRGYFEHRSPSGTDAGDRVAATGYDWSSYGENIARGQDDAAEVVRDWMDSPSHRENILTCGYREVGVGRAYDSDRKAYWVQNFATPDGD